MPRKQPYKIPYRSKAEVAKLTIQEVREEHADLGLDWFQFEVFEKAAYDPILKEQDSGIDQNVVDEDSTAWSIWHEHLYADGIRAFVFSLPIASIRYRLKKSGVALTSWNQRTMSAYDYQRIFISHLKQEEAEHVSG